MPGRRLISALMLVLLLGGAAQAATPLESGRADAVRAREQAAAVRGRQMGLRGELNRLSSRIEELKRRSTGSIVVSGELNAALQRSQEISTELGGLARALQAAEAEKKQKNLRLAELLSEELTRLRKAWETAGSRERRQALSEQLRTLRAERESLKAALPAGIQLPPLEMPDSDDSRDLVEQADTLRDSEDKIRQRMKALEARIREVKQERELDRRMSEFMGDELLFDESDRRLRVQRSSRTLASERGSAEGTDVSTKDPVDVVNAPSPAESNPPQNAPMPTAPVGKPDTGNQTSPPPTQSQGPAPSPTTSAPSVSTLRGTDSRPRVGNIGDALLLDLETQNLGELEQQLTKMRQAAEAYRKKADELEKKARSLDAR